MNCIKETFASGIYREEAAIYNYFIFYNFLIF